MSWIIASVSLFIIIIKSDNRAGEWRDLKDNYRLDPSVHFRLTSSGGSSVFHHPRAKWSGGGEAVECGRWSEKSSLFWIIASISLSITIIESDNRAGEWRDLKVNHWRNPSVYFRRTSSGVFLSVIIVIIVIESVIRDLKDNHRLDPSDHFRLASSGGSSVFHHSLSTYGNRVGEWRDLKDNLRQFQAKVTGGLKDNLRHFRAERSGGGEVVEYERDSGRH